MRTIILSWITAIISAIILLQTLLYKFSGDEESIFIFTKLGLEPYGRIGSGVAELIASILLLIPRYRGLGALLGLGIMAGAIFSHLTVFGINVQNDGGLLFVYALVVFLGCAYNVWVNKFNFLKIIKSIDGYT